MPNKTTEIIQARELIEQVLDRLEVEAYLFEIEPKHGQWELKVECAIDEGWGSFTLDLAEPLPKSDDEQAALLNQCQKQLATCKRTPKE